MLAHPAIALPGYRLTEQLYTSPRTLVYRAVREADQQAVVIKFLKHEHPSFNELAQFRNQYTLAKTLAFPGIVQPYSLEFQGNGYGLVMEDFGGISLREYTELKTRVSHRSLLNSKSSLADQSEVVQTDQSGTVQPLGLSLLDFLTIALQLCDILHELGRNRIIHKDIKPANILIHPITQQVKLIDFSIASQLPRETQVLKTPNVLEGTLRYLSPEQTGRMNRAVDYRSDFYSLGITFYELLTGTVPFRSRDPMELVHCHLTQQPIAIHHLNPQVPPILSQIVAKLIAKNAEDRYQSALGLKHDLSQCLTQWQTQGTLSEFDLRQHDRSDRFLIPERLYGRTAAVTQLLDAFDRVSQGSTELLLVAGFSGIGKTAVIHEVHKPIVQQRGYFIEGKFDQLQRNIPFSAFVQAFRNLMRQLLNESDDQLIVWKSKILRAVGESGQVILEVIPELEQIIGKQLPVPELSGNAAQNRFNLLFQKFIQGFAAADHPLVLFLDDLQWADSASLSLIKLLMSEAAIDHCLILGAYRDNEVSPVHPLMLALEETRGLVTLNTITLTALSPDDINQWVSDTLQCAIELAYPLSQLIYPKTQGNPFFTTQLLKALHDDQQITFDFNQGHWQCDLAQVRSRVITDNVVEFMALQLQKLPSETQEVLKLAACIGNQFDLATLAIVYQQSESQAATALWKALQEGLILPQNEVYKFYQSAEEGFDRADLQAQICTYKFLHDRVQQAAYSLIPDTQRQGTHLQIGRLLRHALPLNEQDEQIFVIVNHFNQGTTLLINESEREELLQLNRRAGQRAKSATAYRAALDYFNISIALLSGDPWGQQYDLTLALYEGAVETAYLTTDFEQMGQLAAIVLTQAHSWLDRVSTYEAKIQACVAQNQLLQALKLAQEILAHLGILLPEHPTQINIDQAFQHTQDLLGDRSIESLLELPQMTAPNPKAAMVILSNIISSAYQVAPNLLPLIILTHIDLSVEYGNAPESTYGYVMYGLMQSSKLNEIEKGYCFGLLGVNLLQRLHAPKLFAKTIFGFNNSLSHWKEPAKDTLAGYLQAYSRGLETGDFEYLALSLLGYDYTACFSGEELTALRKAMEEHRKVMQQFRQRSYFCIQGIYYQTVLNLLNSTADPDRLYSEHYDEDAMIQLHHEANQLLALFQIYFSKLILSYLFQRYEKALDHARLTEQYLDAAAGLLHIPLFFFYDALAHLAIYPTVSEAEQTDILDRVASHLEKLKQWAVYAPNNQAHRWALVAAEQCRVLGQKAEALDLYDRAINLANRHHYLHEAALANELAARFYLEWGKERVAQEYLIAAYSDYARWGAKAKVADLEQRYAQLLTPLLQPKSSPFSVNELNFSSPTATTSTSASSSSSSLSESLDLAAILKASQTLSSEIELSRLLSILLKLVIENAGADKCTLLLMKAESLFVEGFITGGAEPIVLQQIPVGQSQALPLKLIYAVKRRLEPIVLLNATVQTEFVTDPYWQRQAPKSVLCSPILHQGKLLGIVYLENDLTIDVFTSDRINILTILCAQAAISLENARLYQQAKQALEDAKLMQFSIDHAALSIFWVEPDGRIAYTNDAACRDLGYTREEILSKYVYEFDPSFPSETWSDHWQEMRQQESLTFETFHQKKNGVIYPVEITVNYFVFRGKEYHCTFAMNIRDRKQSEAVTKEFQERLTFLVEQTPLGVIEWNLEFKVIGWNPAAEKIFGYSLAEMQGQYAVQIVPEVDRPYVFDLMQALIAQQGGEYSLNQNIRKDGTLITCEWINTPLLTTEGRSIGIFSIVQDVSDRKRAEAALVQKSQELTQALQDLQQAQLQMIQSEKMSALGNLVSGIAHEINNPLGFIAGNLQPALDYIQDAFGLIDLYQQEYPQPSVAIQDEIEAIDLDYVRTDLIKLINSMNLGVQRIRDISTSLRTFSRADRDHQVQFNIHDGIDSTILILKHRLKANGDCPAIQVVKNYGDLPLVNCFPGQLNQVFMNILANAIEVLEDQEETPKAAQFLPTICIHTQLINPEQIQIRIADNGKGMREEIRQQVFNHLFTTKAVGKGTGLGLAIARQIVVEKHKGTIEVRSALDAGSEFVITLPMNAPG